LPIGILGQDLSVPWPWLQQSVQGDLATHPSDSR
jgi:hypothetical protein